MVGKSLLHYRLTAKIGEGGMGAVYRATDTHLDRPVAIKLLPADKVADVERRQRFVQEAKAASALRHPNIVVIHDIASDAGRDFIVMELVEGQSLDAFVGRKSLKLAEVLGLAVQIADGLAAAHAAGIVHRDLKPSNVMVTPDGLVKILDFGLAKLTESAANDENAPTQTLRSGAPPKTQDGYVLGTAAYMSPEQAEGQTVDPRSDIFSFGSVLYEMLTGRKAFARDGPIKTLAAVIDDEPVPLSEVNRTLPDEVQRLVARCLRKDRGRRWQTMSDLRVALQELKEDSASGKLKAAAPPRPAPATRRLGLAAVAIVLLLAGAAAVVWYSARGSESSPAFDILPLTLDAGLTFSPTLPADGSLVAYASNRDASGGFDIWVQRASGGSPLRLTNHPSDDSYPSFAPDGSQIAFRSERDGGGIYLIETLAAGGEARRIGDKGLVPRFSPDGRWIVYLVVPGSLDPRWHKAYVVSPKGGSPRQVLNGFWFAYLTQGAAPVWSPDGTRLLFAGGRIEGQGTRDWWVQPLEGGDAVRTHALENLGLTTAVHYPVAWSGNQAYFASGTTIDGVNLYRARIDPGSWTIRGPAEPITTGPGMRLVVAALPDGRIFFDDMRVSMYAWSVAAQPDSAVTSGKPARLSADLMQNFFPSIARDGSRVAFTAFGGQQPGRTSVRVKDLRAGRETNVPLQGGLGPLKRLSPDGSLLSYVDVVAGRRRTVLLEPGATAGREVCSDCQVYGIFAGNRFALVGVGEGALEKRDLTTGERQLLLSAAPDSVADASLSSDGRWVAWLAGLPDGRSAIRVRAVGTQAGANPRAVTLAEGDFYLSSPDWSPNDRWLFYLSERGDRCTLVARALDPRTKEPVGGEREVALDIEGRWLNFPKGIGTLSVAADRFVFQATEGRGNISVATPARR